MNRFALLLMLSAVLLTSGCGPADAPPPPVPVKPEAELRREKYFGAQVAVDAAIDWRSTGLGIKIMAPGEGPFASYSDRVRIHYTARLKDGTIVDDTRAKGKPAEFAVSRLVRGMTDGLSFLKPGGRAVFYIPPSLGYGNVQAGNIPPLSGLVFDVELLAILPNE